jgi:hypothetical protein
MTASAGAPGAQTGPNPLVRLVRAFRALTGEQRTSALAALVLWITMFLPWYSATVANGKAGVSGVSLSAWSAFGLVQVLVLLISIGTLVLLFVRGERRALGGPSADSALLVLVAGAIAAILILYGMFARPGGKLTIASGIQWGIVIALLAAIWLAWTGLSAYRRQRGAVAAGDAAAAAPERRLTRRERGGGGEVPESARWVEPPRARSDEPSQGAADQRDPAERGDRALRREDATQLSLELPHDHFDE